MHQFAARRRACAALLLLAACRQRSDSASADSVSAAAAVTPSDRVLARADTAPPWAVPPTDSNLACTPTVLRAGDTLTMRMTLPHGPSFMALAPDRTPYIVVFHGEGERDRAQRRSIVPPDSFARMTELRLDTRTQTAGVWVFGRDTNEVLFRVPGTYRLHVGSDMETDGPRYAECLVTYVP